MIPRPRPDVRAVGAVVVLAAVFAACSSAGGSTDAASGPSTAASQDAGEPPPCPTTQPEPLPAGETRTVTMSTSEGDITMQIEADLSPIAAGNFVALADCGYYDGIGFHRVVPGFVIQGGDPTGTGTGGPGYTIEDEAVTATYGRGTVAMARTSEPDSVGSQFFIVLDDAAEEPLAAYNTYQIIGTVTSGMETADAIAAAADAEMPSSPIVMTDVTVSEP
jgi:cyclophilin family peptidyl-prolyl cis-trans isomerase